MDTDGKKNHRLDLRGYLCPVPVIRLEAVLRKAPPGATVTALADDPIAAIDIPHFCREAGVSVRRLSDEGAAAVFLVGPKPSPTSQSAPKSNVKSSA